MNLSNIKAIMFDIDGTLINRKLEMSDNTKYALKKLREKDLVITTNTGRPSSITKRLFDGYGVLDCFDYLFSCNGNEIVDLHNDLMEFVNPIDKDMIKDLGEYFNDDYLSLGYYSEDCRTLFFNKKIDDEALFNDWNKVRTTVPKITDFSNVDIYLPKAIILFKPEHFDELKKKIDEYQDKRIHFFRSGIDCIEIVPNGVSKGSAVDVLVKKLDISNDEILCFGDEESDVPALLKSIGVMVGGKDRIESLGIKYACEDVFNDGVYKFLKEGNLIQ